MLSPSAANNALTRHFSILLNIKRTGPVAVKVKSTLPINGNRMFVRTVEKPLRKLQKIYFMCIKTNVLKCR